MSRWFLISNDRSLSRHYELYRKERLKQMGFEEGDKEGKVGITCV